MRPSWENQTWLSTHTHVTPGTPQRWPVLSYTAAGSAHECSAFESSLTDWWKYVSHMTQHHNSQEYMRFMSIYLGLALIHSSHFYSHHERWTGRWRNIALRGNAGLASCQPLVGTLSWASWLAQWVKNLPAMQETQETWVQFLGQEDSLEEGTATHSSILAWRIPRTRGAWWATVHNHKESDTTEHPCMTNV